jgi:hypothetical protein
VETGKDTNRCVAGTVVARSPARGALGACAGDARAAQGHCQLWRKRRRRNVC